MKKGFEYYYRPNNEAVDNIIKSGTLVFDTNVLLDVFRVENKSSQTLLKLFDALKERVKLPYHVVEEYHEEYLSVLVKQKVSLQNAVKTLKNKEKGLLVYSRNSDFSGLSKYAKTIMDVSLEKAVKSITESYSKTIKHLENEIHNDLIINKLSDIFSDSVLPPLTDEELKSIYNEGITRYNKQVPPGYKDASKDKDGLLKKNKGSDVDEDRFNLFGDLVIWKEILKYADTHQVDMVFVSNDVKEDWVCEICNEKHGPRIELLEEYYSHSSGHTILVYSFEHFISRLNSLMGIVSEKELKTAINSLDEPGRREERLKSRALKTVSEAPALWPSFGDVKGSAAI